MTRPAIIQFEARSLLEGDIAPLTSDTHAITQKKRFLAFASEAYVERFGEEAGLPDVAELPGEERQGFERRLTDEWVKRYQAGEWPRGIWVGGHDTRLKPKTVSVGLAEGSHVYRNGARALLALSLRYVSKPYTLLDQVPGFAVEKPNSSLQTAALFSAETRGQQLLLAEGDQEAALARGDTVETFLLDGRLLGEGKLEVCRFRLSLRL